MRRPFSLSNLSSNGHAEGQKFAWVRPPSFAPDLELGDDLAGRMGPAHGKLFRVRRIRLLGARESG